MNKKMAFWLISVIVVIIGVNVLQHTNWTGSNPILNQYEVLSVYKGAIQVKNMHSGEVTNVYDDNLVRQALAGKIKSGDTLSMK